jgi:hypothetical protein
MRATAHAFKCGTWNAERAGFARGRLAVARAILGLEWADGTEGTEGTEGDKADS